MNKETIILWIYNNKKIERYCKSICPNDYQELISELVIQIYKMDYQKLLLAYNTNYLEYLCFTISKRIIYGNISSSGIFYKRRQTSELQDNHLDIKDIIDEEEQEILERIKELIERKHWYGKTLFKLYYVEGYNLREISEKYGLNIKSIHYAIDKIKKEIKNEL